MKIKRYFNRLVSILLVGCMLITLLPSLGALAADSEETWTKVVSWDFEDGQVGATTKADAGTVEVKEEPEGDGNKVLYIQDTDASTLSSNANFRFQDEAVSGEIAISFRVNMLDEDSALTMTCGSQDKTSNWATSNAGQILRITIGGSSNKRVLFRGGHTSTNSGNVAANNNTYAIGDWTTVKVVLDTDAGTFSVYSGETLLGETDLGYPAAAGVTDFGGINNIAFMTNSNKLAEVYVDDIVVSVKEDGGDSGDEPGDDPVPPELPENAVFFEDFDGETTVKLEKVSPTGASEKTSVQVVELGDNGNKVLQLVDTDGASGGEYARALMRIAETGKELSGKIAISYDMYITQDETSTKNALSFVCGSIANTANWTNSGNYQLLRLKTTNGKKLQSVSNNETKELTTGYNYGQWFSVKVELDTDEEAGTYAIYVKGADEADFPEEPAGSGDLGYTTATYGLDKIDNIGFFSDAAGVTNTYIDNILVTVDSGDDSGDEPGDELVETEAPEGAAWFQNFADEAQVNIQNKLPAAGTDELDTRVTAFAGSKVLELLDKDTGTGYSRALFSIAEEEQELSGEVTISYKLYDKSGDLETGTPGLSFVCGSKANTGNMTNAADYQILRVKTTAGKVQHKGGGGDNATVNNAYTQGQWVTFKVVLNTQEATYTIYVDDVEKASGDLSYTSDSYGLDKIDNIGFMTEKAGVGHVYIDDITVTVKEIEGPGPDVPPVVDPDNPFDDPLVVSGGSFSKAYDVEGQGNQVLTFTVTPSATSGLKGGVRLFTDNADGNKVEVLRFKLDGGTARIAEYIDGSQQSYVDFGKYTTANTAYTFKLVIVPAAGDDPAFVKLYELKDEEQTQWGDTVALTGADVSEITQLTFFTDGSSAGTYTYTGIGFLANAELSDEEATPPGGGEGPGPDVPPVVDPDPVEPPVEDPDDPWPQVYAQDFEGKVSFQGTPTGTEVIVEPGTDNHVMEVTDADSNSGYAATLPFDAQSGNIAVSFRVKVLDENNVLYVGLGSHAQAGSWASGSSGRILRLTFANNKLQFWGGHASNNGTETNNTYTAPTDWMPVKVVLDTKAGKFFVYSGETYMGYADLGYNNANLTNFGEIDNIAFSTNTSGTTHVYVDDVVVAAEDAVIVGNGGTEYWDVYDLTLDMIDEGESGEGFTTTTDQVIATLPESGVTMAVGAAGWNRKAPSNGKPVTINDVTYTKYITGKSGNSPKVNAGTGEYFKFAIPADIDAGELTVALRVNSGKALVVQEDGVDMAGYEEYQPAAAATTAGIKINVVGGKTYTVYVDTSMPYFYGFSFRPVDMEADIALFQEEIDKLGFDWIRGENTDPDAVDKDLELTNFYTSRNFGGADVNWTSNSVAVSGNGKVNRLAADTLVTLTAHISVQQISYLALDKTFQVTVKALSDDTQAVASAKAALSLGAISAVKKDLELPAEGMHGTAITWVSSNPDVLTVDASSGLGVIHPNDSVAQTVTLTATITRGNITETKEFEVTVAPSKILDVNSWAYATAEGTVHFVPVDGGKLHSINVTNNNQHLDTNDYKFKVEILGADGTVKAASREYTASAFFTHGVGVSENVALDLAMDSGDTFRVTAYDDAKTYVTVTHSAADDVVAPGAKIYVIGDSTAAPYENKKYPQTGWAQVLEGFFDGVEVVDLAIPGRSSLDYKTRPQFETLKTSIQPGDYLIIQFGHNDSHNADSSIYTDPTLDRFADGAEVPSYKKHMAEYVTLAWDAGAYPIIATSISRRKLNDTDGLRYGNAAKALAAELSIPCVDVLGASNGWVNHVGLEESIDMFNIIKPQDSRFFHDPQYAESEIRESGNDAVVANWDNTHVNYYGAKLIAMFAADGIKALGIPVGTKRNSEIMSTTLPHYADAISGEAAELPEGLTVAATAGSELRQYPVSGAGKHELTFTVTPSAAGLSGGVKFFTGTGSGKQEVLRLEMSNGTFRLFVTSNAAARAATEGIDLGTYTPGTTYTLKVVITPALGEEQPAQVEVYKIEGAAETQMGETCTLGNTNVKEITRLDFFADTATTGEFTYTGIDFQTETIPELEYSPEYTASTPGGDDEPTPPPSGELPENLNVTAGASSVTNKYPVTTGEGNVAMTFTVTPTATTGLKGGVKFYSDNTELVRFKLDGGVFKLSEVVDGNASYTSLGAYEAGKAYTVKLVFVPAGEDGETCVYACLDGQQIGSIPLTQTDPKTINNLRFFTDSNGAGTLAYTNISYASGVAFTPQTTPAATSQYLLKNPGAWTLSANGNASITNEKLIIQGDENSNSNRIDVSGDGIKSLSFDVAVNADDLKNVKAGVNFAVGGKTVLRFKMQNGGFRLSDMQTDAGGSTVYQQISGYFNKKDSFRIKVELYPATATQDACVKVYKDGKAICTAYTPKGETASLLGDVNRLYFFADSNSSGTCTYSDMVYKTGPMTPAQTGAIDFVKDGWKLQLPVEDPNKPGSVMEVSPAELADGYSDEYFYTGTDENGDHAVVFHSPVEGFKTTNAKYTRSELREMLDPSDKTVNWTWEDTHILTTEQRVAHVPASGQVITSQIHGIEKNGDNANPLVKVRYVYDAAAGTGKIVVELKETTASDSGDQKHEFANVALGQKYKTVIKVEKGVASVTISTVENGAERAQTYRYDFASADANWKNTLYYFKVGNYIQDNADTGEDAYSDVWVYSATVQHPSLSTPGGNSSHGKDKTDYSDGGSTVTETQVDGTVVTVHTTADGGTMRIQQNPDGTVQITVTTTNGSANVAVDANGKTQAKVDISDLAASRAQQNGDILTLPMPQLDPGKDLDSAPVVEITKKVSGELLAKMPVNHPTAGTVVVAVRPDGAQEIVKMSVVTEGGILFKVSGNMTVKLVDNARWFDDVGSDHWAAEAVDFASGRELLMGTAENLFSPDGATTRAMVVTILARLDGVDTSGGETWYSKGMDWAVSQSVSDGTNPDAPISREQFVTMLYRYGGQPAAAGQTLGGFADSAAVSAWASQAMEWAVETGVMRGRTDGTLDPAGATTRAEAATLLMRYCKWALGVPLEVSAPSAGAEETVAFENDFEAETLGRAWVLGAKVVELDGNQVVEITDSSATQNTVLNYSFPAQAGKVTISFKLYIDPEDADSVIVMTAGSFIQTGRYSSNSSGEFLRLKTVPSSKRFQFRGGDSTKTSAVNGGGYRCGEWTDIKVIVDTDAGTFRVYAGGELLGENQPMSAKTITQMKYIDNISFMTEKEGLSRVYIDDVKVTGMNREYSVWDEAVGDYITVAGGGTGLLKDSAQWSLKQGEIKGGTLIVTAGEDSASNKIAVSGKGNKELTFTVVSDNESGAKGGVRFVSGGNEVLRFKLDGGKFKVSDMRVDEAGKVLYETLGSYSEDTAYEVRVLILEKTATQAAGVKVYVDGRQLGGAYALTDEAAAALANVTELNFFTDKAVSGTLTYTGMDYRTGVAAGADAPAQGGASVDLSQTPAGTGAIDFLKDGWKIQIPIENPAKAGSVMERTPQELADGYTDEFIFAAKDDDGVSAVVFHSPVEGFKTGNTSYARSELRELLDPSDSKVNWTWQGTHTLVAEERVTHVPASGQVITSQIHGIEQNGDNANPLVKVRYVYDWATETGKVVVELKNTTSPTSYDFKYNFPNVALGQKYKTEIQVVDGSVCVTISTTDPDGAERSETYRHDFVAADPYWKETWYYFKLGNYIQDNTDTGEGAYADVWVYSSGITHSDSVEKIPVERITMDQSAVSIRSGERTGLSVSAEPIKAYDKSVTWAVTAGSDVAVVDKDGFVTGIKEGVATVTATSVSNPAATASCTVTVKDVAVVEVKPIFAQDFGTDGAKTDPASYGGAGVEIAKDAPAGTDVSVVHEGGNNLVTLRDDSASSATKLSFVFAPQTDTTTIAFKVRVDDLGEHTVGGTDFGRMYIVAAGSDNWYSDDTELFRIRNNAKGTLGNFSGLTYVLTNYYNEITMNADKVTGGYGDWVDVVYIVTPNNGTAKANTTDVYMNGYPVAMAVANRNSVDYVNRLDIQTGTADKLTFSVDDVKVYTGIVLPENTALIKPTALELVRVPSVMAVADSAQAAVEVTPAEGYENVSWSVVSGDAVTISDDGYVTAAKAGVAEIRAQSVLDSAVYAQRTITVQPTVIRPESLVVPATVHVTPGGQQQMQVTVLPENATEKGLKYEIASGSDVAAVDSRGVVTGKAVGTASVRVTSLSDPSVYETVPVSVTQTLTTGELIFADNFNAGELDSANWSVSLAKDNTFVEMQGGAMTFIDANTAANPKVTLDFTPVSGKVSIQFKIKVEGEVTIQGGSVKSTGYRNLRIAFGSGNITATANESFCIRSNGTYFTYNTSGATYVEMPGNYDISEWNEVTLVTTINASGPDTTDVYVNGVKVLAGATNKVDYPAIDKLCFSADTANVAAFTIDDLGIWAGDLSDKPADMNAKRFSDVPAGYWAQEAISFASQRGLLTGVGNGAFAPDATTTRASLVTILARLDGVDTSGGETWYSKGTDWAVSKGISDGTNPDAPISREQFVTMLYRYAGQPAAAGQTLGNFVDGNAVSAWAIPAMEWAVAAGVMTGRTDGTLDPAGTTTRAEAAVLLTRYCQQSEAGR